MEVEHGSGAWLHYNYHSNYKYSYNENTNTNTTTLRCLQPLHGHMCVFVYVGCAQCCAICKLHVCMYLACGCMAVCDCTCMCSNTHGLHAACMYLCMPIFRQAQPSSTSASKKSLAATLLNHWFLSQTWNAFSHRSSFRHMKLLTNSHTDMYSEII